ncbi:MAG: DUF1841 family protein [Gammaproteobacteria bacterium]|nr:DUF1841 family protein [Gammaproteobacteria bacterium]MDH5304533.1 DUF1841 family protein [Gammaproteobacteria bacterium]MDH5323169.1 DUF1841 family protein [Gammaproteobacteria bacterium]
MIFGQDRSELRKMYADAWHKHCVQMPMSPLEAQIAAVVAAHPEYHAAVRGDLEADFTVAGGVANPFLHMGLHMSIREQVAVDRPAGISSIFVQLSARLADAHAAEHRMLDCLAETLWEAQRRQGPPDEAAYLERLRAL